MKIDYGKIIHRSVSIIRKNNWLWVYALTLALFSGGSGSGGGGGGSSSTKNDVDMPEDFPQRTSEVLGETITVVREWISQVPLATWITVSTVTMVGVLIWMIVSWIIQSWAKGSLIYALDEADNEKTVTLPDTSPHGRKSASKLILLGIISFTLTVSVLLAAVVLVGGGYALFRLVPPLDILWLIVSILCTVIAVVVLMLLFSMVGIYADRLIVLKEYTAWNAWKKGLSLSKGNFLPTVIMGIINQTIGCVGGCLSTIVILLVLGIPAFILIVPVLNSESFTLPGLPAITGLGVLLFVFLQATTLVKAAFILFNFSNWNLFFKEIWQKENNP